MPANNKPIDKTKKSNKRCVNCVHWKGEYLPNKLYDTAMRPCARTGIGKYYYNLCKGFEWNPGKRYVMSPQETVENMVARYNNQASKYTYPLPSDADILTAMYKYFYNGSFGRESAWARVATERLKELIEQVSVKDNKIKALTAYIRNRGVCNGCIELHGDPGASCPKLRQCIEEGLYEFDMSQGVSIYSDNK